MSSLICLFSGVSCITGSRPANNVSALSSQPAASRSERMSLTRKMDDDLFAEPPPDVVRLHSCCVL